MSCFPGVRNCVDCIRGGLGVLIGISRHVSCHRLLNTKIVRHRSMAANFIPPSWFNQKNPALVIFLGNILEKLCDQLELNFCSQASKLLKWGWLRFRRRNSSIAQTPKKKNCTHGCNWFETNGNSQDLAYLDEGIDAIRSWIYVSKLRRQDFELPRVAFATTFSRLSFRTLDNPHLVLRNEDNICTRLPH